MAEPESFPCGICTHLMKSITAFDYSCERCNRQVKWAPVQRPDPTMAMMMQAMWELHLDELTDDQDQS